MELSIFIVERKCLEVPSGILSFGCKYLRRAITLKVFLNNKIKSISKNCPVCNNEKEIIEHVLFHCEYARAVGHLGFL